MDVELLKQVKCEKPGLSDHDLLYGQLTSKVDRKIHTLRAVKCYKCGRTSYGPTLIPLACDGRPRGCGQPVRAVKPEFLLSKQDLVIW